MSRRTSTRYSGLSKSVSFHTFKGRSRQTTILRAGKQAERLREIGEQRAAALEGTYTHLICSLKLV